MKRFLDEALARVYELGIRNASIEDISTVDKVTYSIYFLRYTYTLIVLIFRHEYKAASHSEKAPQCEMRDSIVQRNISHAAFHFSHYQRRHAVRDTYTYLYKKNLAVPQIIYYINSYYTLLSNRLISS